MRDADAPFFADLAGIKGRAHWVKAADGTRLRAAVWPGGTRGTALIFTGRTEYIEKYGHVVAALQARGFSVATLDWRGQGLSDRPTHDPRMSDATNFADYQQDVAAFLADPAVAALPGPRVLFAHSLGGCIGFRALDGGLNVAAAVMSAPMLGIQFPLWINPLAHMVITMARPFGMGGRYAPGTGPDAYPMSHKFEGNVLSSDADNYARMRAHLTAKPELALGGPSLRWLAAARRETWALAKLPPPELPMLGFLGTDEKVVAKAPITRRFASMPDAKLHAIKGARHEVWMERPAIQAQVWAATDAFLETLLG